MADLTPDQAIEQLKKLPEDKQRLVLGKLTPDARKGILDKLKGTEFAAGPENIEGTYQMVKDGNTLHVPFSQVLNAGKAGFEITPEDYKTFTKDYTHTQGIRSEIDAAVAPEDESTWAGRGLNILKGTGAGLISPVNHPVQTLEGMWNQVEDAMPAYTPQGLPVPNVEGTSHLIDQNVEAIKHPVYTASQFIGPMLVTHAATKAAPYIPGVRAIPELKNKVLENLRPVLRNKFGGGEEFTQKKVDEFKNDNEKARAGIKAADEKTETKRGAVDEINKDRQQVHQDKLVEHAEDVQKQKDTHQERLNKWEKKRAKALQEHQNTAKAIQAENEQGLKDHIAKVEEVAKQNNAARAIIDAQQGLEDDITQKSSQLSAKIDAAEKKAKAENNSAWAKWREKVGNARIVPTEVTDAIKEARKRMDPEDIAELRKIMKEAKPSPEETTTLRDTIAKSNYGVDSYESAPPAKKMAIDRIVDESGIDPDAPINQKSIDAQRLHVWKTQLEYAIRRANRENVRGGIGMALDAVRNLENELSAEAGASAELKEARALHGPYKDTFVNSPNKPTTVASAYQRGITPEFIKSEESNEMGAKLGNYDPDIPKLGQDIADARERLSKLKSESAARGMLKEVPEPPKPKPLPPEPEIEPQPKESDYKKPSKNPSVKPYGEPEGRPSLPKAEDFTPERMEKMKESLKKYGATGAWVWRLIAGSGLEAGQSLLMHGTTPERLGTFAGGLFVGQAALKLFTSILSRDSILEWMAKPTKADIKIIESLPEHDAARLKSAIQALSMEEKKANPNAPKTKVAPAIAAFLGSKAPEGKKLAELKDLKQQAAQRNPSGVTVVAPDGSKHVFPDEASAVKFRAAVGIK